MKFIKIEEKPKRYVLKMEQPKREKMQLHLTNKVSTRHKEFHKSEKMSSIWVWHQQIDQEQSSFQTEQNAEEPVKYELR